MSDKVAFDKLALLRVARKRTQKGVSLIRFVYPFPCSHVPPLPILPFLLIEPEGLGKKIHLQEHAPLTVEDVFVKD